MKSTAKVLSLTELVNSLQDVAYSGKAEYEIDLDSETHRLVGFAIDDENKKVVLLSEEIV